MDMLILKTNINSKDAFSSVKMNLNSFYPIEECTIDLDDSDKVMRVIGNDLNKDEVVNSISNLGYVCEELPD